MAGFKAGFVILALCLSAKMISASEDSTSLSFSSRSFISQISGGTIRDVGTNAAHHGESCLAPAGDVCDIVDALTCVLENANKATCQCFSKSNFNNFYPKYPMNMVWEKDNGRCSSSSGSICTNAKLEIPDSANPGTIYEVQLHCVKGATCEEFTGSEADDLAKLYKIGVCKGSGSDSGSGSESLSIWKISIPIAVVLLKFLA